MPVFNPFQTSPTEVYQRIWRRIEHHKHNPSPPHDILDQSTANHLLRVKQGGYALVSDVTTFELERSKGCEISMMDETFFPMRYAMALQNNSAYREIVSNT